MPPRCPHLSLQPLLRLLPCLSLDVCLEAFLRTHTLYFVPGHHPLGSGPQGAWLSCPQSCQHGCACWYAAWGLQRGKVQEAGKTTPAGLRYLPAWERPVNQGAQLRLPRAGVGGVGEGNVGAGCHVAGSRLRAQASG